MEMFYMDESNGFSAKLKVVGVGGGGCNAINTMVEAGLQGVEFIAINTDVQTLNMNRASVKIQIGSKLTRGLGAGANPDVGRQAALEDADQIAECLKGADMVFITCGLGGGTGTGASPVIADVSKELGALTVAVVTKPFPFEGKMRALQAEDGLTNLKSRSDTLITIPNQRLMSIGGKHMSIKDAFLKADEVLLYAVRSISDLIISSGHINVDFADVKTVMSERGMAIMGVGVGTGDKRAVEAAHKAISSPLLEDISIHGAKGVLINVTGNMDMTLHEVTEASTLIQEQAHEDARVIWGLVFDESMEDSVRITVIATGFGDEAAKSQEKPEKPEKARRENLFLENGTIPAFVKKNVKIDYREAKPKHTSIDLDDDRYDIPTFLRKQAD
ncbi:MAG TPA: cell division protein FtsZ [Syntrophorhabdales bacterium]|nr:cell division protein FtsZ [Syntrophorhabdales bacterium]